MLDITVNRDITSGMPVCTATISTIPMLLAIVTLSLRMFSDQFKEEPLVFSI